MTDNLEKEFGTAIEIIDGSTEDSLTLHVPKRVTVTNVLCTGWGLFMILGYIFECRWFPDLWAVFAGALFCLGVVVEYLGARQKVRESHLIRYALHLEKRLAED